MVAARVRENGIAEDIAAKCFALLLKDKYFLYRP
jgi:hypothetical protein